MIEIIWRQCVACGKRIKRDSWQYESGFDYPGGFICGKCRQIIYREVKDEI